MRRKSSSCGTSSSSEVLSLGAEFIRFLGVGTVVTVDIVALMSREFPCPSRSIIALKELPFGLKNAFTTELLPQPGSLVLSSSLSSMRGVVPRRGKSVVAKALVDVTHSETPEIFTEEFRATDCKTHHFSNSKRPLQRAYTSMFHCTMRPYSPSLSAAQIPDSANAASINMKSEGQTSVVKICGTTGLGRVDDNSSAVSVGTSG